MIKFYQIIDRQTGLQVGKDYTNKNRARGRADKLDNEYGAYRYYVESIAINSDQFTGIKTVTI